MVPFLVEEAKEAKRKTPELSHVTFDSLVEADLLRPAIRVPGGARFFQRKDVVALAKKFPPVRPPNRIGIVGWLKGKRPKKAS